jgi:hypothetical protein
MVGHDGCRPRFRLLDQLQARRGPLQRVRPATMRSMSEQVGFSQSFGLNAGVGADPPDEVGSRRQTDREEWKH